MDGERETDIALPISRLHTRTGRVVSITLAAESCSPGSESKWCRRVNRRFVAESERDKWQ
ncbi:predicted protein [Pyrenophora tritici-repentis Pt-1C-BFP]|uniref:Uncharacterized protein n=1 Tax=Pyrenophora tritici-repentis (strain Pt-1C-BFP) TaxID=426418 RepID=B2VXS3_PYRTR|nr:uncharacterized protein PTRG_03319 [Pyrenophora tritici-repentis Pt-1C-BFP]EDU45842.1 predicted protein [Pyrenophora tritici-repentis Pt-1C-BFP]